MPVLLQFNASLNKGSTGHITEQIGMLANKAGWTVYIVHGARYQCLSKMHSIQSVSLMQERFHALKSILFDAQGLGSYFATEKLIAQIEKISPDIIHLHNIHGYYLNYVVLFKYLYKKNIPVVWTLHDCWSLTGHCVHFDAINCNKWKVGCNLCPAINNYPKSILLDRSQRNYNLKKKYFTSLSNMVIVPVSYWLEGVVKQSFLSKYPTRVICNGVDTDLFTPQNINLKKKMGLEGKFILLGVATTWNENKGLYDYIKLSYRLSENYKIILIGINRKLRKRLPQTIITIDRTNNLNELVDYYSMADVVLNLSYEESFGLTTVEGLACGTPSIVYDRTASPELITSQTGYVVKAGKIEDVVASINKIKNIGKEKYSIACRQRAISYYNMNNNFKAYVDLYNSILYKSKQN